ncbi:MAG: anthranilate phosphoribosyltransferase [Candidatus Dormibacteria bacterium]
MQSAVPEKAPAATPALVSAGDLPGLLRRSLAGESLGEAEVHGAIAAIVDGRLSRAQAAGLLVALAARGETVAEVVGAARAMRERARVVEHDLPLVVDIVGTGGDGAGTINLSTAAALVVAGTGVVVAKHGNRGASSPCGSADVLEALGVALECEPAQASQLLRVRGIAFLFAPVYHPAMRVVAPIRRELGVRTIFNLLGPLSNPARAHRQLVGVFARSRIDLVADALSALGVEAGAVVHSASGLDEVAGEGPTYVTQFDRSGRRSWVLDPADHGVHVPLAQLRGGAPVANAAALSAVLEGSGGPAAEVVALNAALALVVAERAGSMAEGMVLAQQSLASGAARSALEALRQGAAPPPAQAVHA